MKKGIDLEVNLNTQCMGFLSQWQKDINITKAANTDLPLFKPHAGTHTHHTHTHAGTHTRTHAHTSYTYPRARVHTHTHIHTHTHTYTHTPEQTQTNNNKNQNCSPFRKLTLNVYERRRRMILERRKPCRETLLITMSWLLARLRQVKTKAKRQRDHSFDQHDSSRTILDVQQSRKDGGPTKFSFNALAHGSGGFRF